MLLEIFLSVLLIHERDTNLYSLRTTNIPATVMNFETRPTLCTMRSAILKSQGCGDVQQKSEVASPLRKSKSKTYFKNSDKKINFIKIMTHLGAYCQSAVICPSI